MSHDYNKKNIVLAKNLRNHATREENKLWYEFLRTYPIKFQRQKAIGNYIVDFYCSKAELVIELDGNQHDEEQALKDDGVREYLLANEGIFTLRFPNSSIWENFSGVCDGIDRMVKARIKNHG